jgi:hypothetical protein
MEYGQLRVHNHTDKMDRQYYLKLPGFTSAIQKPRKHGCAYITKTENILQKIKK